MTKQDETVQTSLGEAKVATVGCDGCGQVALASESTYIPRPGWMQLKTRDIVKTYPSEILQDFCSVDCIVRFLVPDIYSTDPQAVLRAVAGLKRIETSLESA